ncbi:MAG: 6-phosphogluconolactonase, partial [Thermomicrobiales bacterium]|nr:6-phosphogluconolactonase [Thermomicrobiales bacterium]
EMGRLLAEERFRERVPWDRLHIFWGDERWVPLESPESNAGEAMRGFLDLVGIPEDRVHPFETVGVTPEESAARYQKLIGEIVPGLSSPMFDLVLLGMGDDGHTASLFPGTPAIHEEDRLVAPNFVPKLDTTRLTFTPPLINAAKEVAFLAAGGSKAQRLAEVVEGPIEPERLPSQTIRPAGGPLWLVDRAAAGSLTKKPE